MELGQILDLQIFLKINLWKLIREKKKKHFHALSFRIPVGIISFAELRSSPGLGPDDNCIRQLLSTPVFVSSDRSSYSDDVLVYIQ